MLTVLFGIVIETNIFQHHKINSFEAIQNGGNQTECSRLEQRSVVKLLVTEKSKTNKFTNACVMFTEKYGFVKKLFTNRLEMSLLLRVRIKMTVQEVATH